MCTASVSGFVLQEVLPRNRESCLTIENGFAIPEIAEPHYMLNSTKHPLVESSAAGWGFSKPKCVRGSTDSRNRPGDASPVVHEPF